MMARFRRFILSVFALVGVFVLLRWAILKEFANRPENYYVSRQKRLIREFDEVTSRVRHVFAAHYGAEGTDEMLTEARWEYDTLIPQLPYIGGKQPFTHFLVSTAWFLALYRVLKRRGRPLDEIGKLIYEATEALISSYPEFVRHTVGKMSFDKGYVDKLRKGAEESKEGHYPGDYIYDFVEGDGQTFDFGLNYLQCASCKFLDAQGARELTPYICPIDRLYSRAFGWGLTRTRTLAEGDDRCDFRFRKSGHTWVASSVLPSVFAPYRQNLHHPWIYNQVPKVQVDRLLTFRSRHPVRHLNVAGVDWEYMVCGKGEEIILMLPGGARLAETCFVQIESLEDRYRMIIPTYPPVWTIDEIADGLAAILNAEHAEQVDVIGQSYGGWVAQVLIRRYPDLVRKLVLSGTGPLVVSRSERLLSRMLVLLLPRLPEWLLMDVVRLIFRRVMSAAVTEEQFWKAYLNEIFLYYLSKADVLSHYRTGADTLKEHYTFAKGEKSRWPGEILVILGENDPFVSEEDRQRFPAIYPHLHIREISDAGHTVGVANPTRYAALVNAFLADHDEETPAQESAVPAGHS